MQLVTPVDTAFFSFSCALPGEPPDSEPGTLAADIDPQKQSSSSSANASGSSSDNTCGSSCSSDGDVGWEIQEGGECTYFYSLDGGNFSVVRAPIMPSSSSASSLDGNQAVEDNSGTQEGDGGGTNTLLLSNLADGEHELR